MRLMLAAAGLPSTPGATRSFAGSASRLRFVADDRVVRDGSLAGAFLASRIDIVRYLRARGAGEHAEDILQDLWLRLNCADIAEVVNNPRAYLFRAAHNMMLDHVREQRRRARREEGLYGEIVSSTADDYTLLEARDNLARIDRALRDLGARTDAIFRRHRLDGVPQRQIAEELGVTLSAVEKHLQRAYRAVAATQAAAERDIAR